jgi:tryptophanyl-tRNA synthetase
VPDKQHLSRVLTEALAPIRERRLRWAGDPDAVRDVIADGNRKARAGGGADDG